MQTRVQYVSLIAMLIVGLALIASCSDGTDDITVSAPETSASPATTAAPTTIPTTTAAPTTTASEIGVDPLPSSFRAFLLNDMTQEGTVSEASAQCAVDKMSDEFIDGYFNLDPDDQQAVEGVMTELFEIQSQCLTPAEMEAMGFAPAG